MIDKDISQYLSLEDRARNLFGENYDLESCVEELRQYRSFGLTPSKVGKLHNLYEREHKAAIKNKIKVDMYSKIGTMEECRAAVAKQKAETPNFEGDGYSDGELVYDTWICPGCGKDYEIDFEKHEYCPNCGQKISWEDWGEEDE